MFNNTLPNADDLTVNDRKVTQRNLQVVAFTGTLPPPGAPASPFESMASLIDLYAGGRRADLVFDITGVAGARLVKNLERTEKAWFPV